MRRDRAEITGDMNDGTVLEEGDSTPSSVSSSSGAGVTAVVTPADAAPHFPPGLVLPGLLKLALRGLLDTVRGLVPKAAMEDVERTMALRFFGLPMLAALDCDRERASPRAARAPLRKLARPGEAPPSVVLRARPGE